jgi:signal transduction histidine kinase
MSPLPEDLERLLHELRGPLNAIAMHAEVLKRAVDDPVAAGSVRTIQAEVERLAEMLDDGMQMVALEPGERRPLDLRQLVQGALEAARLKDVVLAAAPWPDVRGDPGLLARAVMELVQNAVEATGAGAAVPEVSAARGPDGTTALIVRDFGPGLRSTNPKALLRLRRSTKPGHRGLGLLAVERIARLHGGQLRFESPGVGARVTLLLPGGDT